MTDYAISRQADRAQVRALKKLKAKGDSQALTAVRRKISTAPLRGIKNAPFKKIIKTQQIGMTTWALHATKGWRRVPNG